MGDRHPHHLGELWRYDDVPGPADPAALSARRVEELHSDRDWLLAAISTLQASARPTDILANLPTVLTLANGVVHGMDGQWDHRLAATCRDWIATRADSCGPAELADARADVAAAALPVAAGVDAWIERGDALVLATEGAMALAHLARVAADAHATVVAATATAATAATSPRSRPCLVD